MNPPDTHRLAKGQVRSAGRWHFALRLHHLLFLAFTLVAAIPIAVLAVWEGNTALQTELDSVRERHLLVARNLTTTASRYVGDVKAVFSLAFESGALSTPVPGLAELLLSLNVEHVCILKPDGQVEAVMEGLSDKLARPLDPKATPKYNRFKSERLGRSYNSTPDGICLP